jgi:hypothetical protein
MNHSLLASAAGAIALCFAGVAEGQTLGLPAPPSSDQSPVARVIRAGNAAFLNGDLPLADADYRAALKRAPASAIAAFDLGLVELHEGRRARGLADMDRGIASAVAQHLDPSRIDYLKRLRAAFTPAA